MSIYATWFFLDDDAHEDGCTWWKGQGDAPCSCGLPMLPYVYRGSHILPQESDERGGHVEIGAIPNFITRNGSDDGETLHDWLRLSVNDGVVVLTRLQVERMRDVLTEWLTRPLSDE